MRTASVMFSDRRPPPRDPLHRVFRRALIATSPMAAAVMGFLSRNGRKSLLGSADLPAVSLTSYGNRINHVSATIESIGRGSQKPSRIVLWLDDPEVFARLPKALRRQQTRGLAVKLTKNLGPHTKYAGMLEESRALPHPFVTADDDIIYPRWWLSRLVRAAAETPGNVVCHRAHRLQIREEGVAPYGQWPSVETTEAHPTVFATGVSGVLYPPQMIEALRIWGHGHVTAAASCDDVWLHLVAVSNNIPVRQIAKISQHFWITPQSQGATLMQRNLIGGNDAAIRALYGDHALGILSRG